MEFEDCEYFSYKLIDDDIFGHPRYEYYCSKSGELRITYGAVCIRCCKKKNGGKRKWRLTCSVTFMEEKICG